MSANELIKNPGEVKCKGCHKTPDELEEYTSIASQYKLTPTEFVRREEGTFNPNTNLFWCTDCYVKMGMPLGKA